MLKQAAEVTWLNPWHVSLVLTPLTLLCLSFLASLFRYWFRGVERFSFSPGALATFWLPLKFTKSLACDFSHTFRNVDGKNLMWQSSGDFNLSPSFRFICALGKMFYKLVKFLGIFVALRWFLINCSSLPESDLSFLSLLLFASL